MKRARLRALERTAAVVLGKVGTADGVDVVDAALDDPEPSNVSTPRGCSTASRVVPTPGLDPGRSGSGELIA
jgi:hypothetical protein